ncbi:hypothetical protein GLOTRDRAFT_132969 [Gloeophyllum trabeum ATCC 11539]|uniref:Uncharacterized protein n=1 Tax=Gloeophyllum trabeum (strain ATCC 11539 / FP-39264 / Madison 617) TaxID=670483 RepID=S7PVE2_GLOTA|nr:uncharacterized protein GLOTRDRAFT_132969 [Gloeophyllum trabeum ATCC 11539]EPQ51601.1 hypothetical protein GLOTRDRAFT_132969 [Gloeophyllum trabeum ATCC 11539]
MTKGKPNAPAQEEAAAAAAAPALPTAALCTPPPPEGFAETHRPHPTSPYDNLLTEQLNRWLECEPPEGFMKILARPANCDSRAPALADEIIGSALTKTFLELMGPSDPACANLRITPPIPADEKAPLPMVWLVLVPIDLGRRLLAQEFRYVLEDIETDNELETYSYTSYILDCLSVRRIASKVSGGGDAAIWLLCLDDDIFTSIEQWIEFRKELAQMTYPHLDDGVGRPFFPRPCAICGCASHSSGLCPLPSLPGWLGPDSDTIGLQQKMPPFGLKESVALYEGFAPHKMHRLGLGGRARGGASSRSGRGGRGHGRGRGY